MIRAFRLCAERGFPTGSEYCLHRGNLDVFADSVKLLAELGCTSLKVNSISEEGEACGIRDYILTPAEKYGLFLDYLPRFFEEGMPLDLMLSGMFMNRGQGGNGSLYGRADGGGRVYKRAGAPRHGIRHHRHL